MRIIIQVPNDQAESYVNHIADQLGQGKVNGYVSSQIFWYREMSTCEYCKHPPHDEEICQRPIMRQLGGPGDPPQWTTVVNGTCKCIGDGTFASHWPPRVD